MHIVPSLRGKQGILAVKRRSPNKVDVTLEKGFLELSIRSLQMDCVRALVIALLGVVTNLENSTDDAVPARTVLMEVPPVVAPARLVRVAAEAAASYYYVPNLERVEELLPLLLGHMEGEGLLGRTRYIQHCVAIVENLYVRGDHGGIGEGSGAERLVLVQEIVLKMLVARCIDHVGGGLHVEALVGPPRLATPVSCVGRCRQGQ
mmetsp:Transcript_15613/g.29183  ORF Transcript_15613/g.29183 Transcript_15613/m.29183 type:complete len:205 (+) Transcript_15613:1872-2486(+)